MFFTRDYKEGVNITLLESIIDAIPDAIILTNSQREIVAVNDSFQNHFYHTPDEVMGKSTDILYGSDNDFQETGEAKFNVNSSLEKDVYEMTYRRKNGDLFQGQTVGNILRNSEGSVIGYIKLIRDISGQKIIEEGLRETRELFKLLSEASSDMIALHEPDGTYVYVSPSVEELLGYTPEELIGTDPYELFHSEDLQRIREEAHEKNLRGEQTSSFQYRIEKKDGHFLWFETTTEPVLNDDGDVIKLRTASRDITKRKRLELLLQESNKLASVGGWELDVQSSHMILTDEIYHIHELPVGADLKLEEGLQYYPEKARVKVEEALNRAIETGEGYDFEVPFITAGNNPKWVRAIGRAQKDEDGKVYKLYGVFQDLSERKEMEDNLIKARKKAEAANQTKSLFLANMSHEIRTPMNSILGFAELLKKEATTDLSQNYLDNILNSGQILLKLINDILDLSKIEAGKEDLHLSPVSIERFADELREIFKIKSQQKGIDFSTEIKDGLPEALLLDESHLRQILFNLVGNAVKFTEKGKVTVTFEAEFEGTEFSTVDLYVKVTDTGIGIAKNKLDSIFEAFIQEKREISNRYGGTGLGLSISKKLASMMNGHIQVESKPGKGSTFTLKLPNVVTSSTIDQRYQIDIQDADWIVLKEAKVLVVDDINTNRQLILEYLKNQPLTIFEATDGREAVEVANQHHPDLILMDIKMPNLNGIEAMRLIRDNYPDTIFVALTASGFLGYEKEMRELGFNGYLRKPVRLIQLLLELGEHIGFVEKPAHLETEKTERAVENTVSLDHLTNDQLNRLSEQWYPKLLQSYQNIDRANFLIHQYEEFSTILREIAHEFKIEQFSSLVVRLNQAIDQFDVDSIENHIRTFEHLNRELQQSNRLNQR